MYGRCFALPSRLRIDHTATLTFGSLITLGVLRDAINDLDGWPDDAQVTVTHYRGDQREGSSTTIKVQRR